MRPLLVEPIHVLGNIGARNAHTVIDSEIYPLVLHAAPQALDKHVVAPGTSAIHAEFAALGQHDIGELRSSELAALVGVDNVGCAVSHERLLNDFLSLIHISE